MGRLIALRLALRGLRKDDLRYVVGYDEAVDRANRAEMELQQVLPRLAALLTAQGRMLDDWAEASPKRQRDLWRNLHEAADEVRAALDESGEPT